MNERNDYPACERAPDLIAFLYNETNESETRDFELHLKECSACREEVASFGVVRQSITAWRDEALSGFVSTQLANAPTRKSAIAALRQFFDLSPLWLKGATAFAVLAVFALVGLAIFRAPQDSEHASTKPVDPNLIYTQQDVDRMLKEALTKEETAKPPDTVVVVQSPKPKRIVAPSQAAKSRRPLTRAEREQLAADLRLLPSDDDVDLTLLGDRINNQ
jgi:hypothetical protein